MSHDAYDDSSAPGADGPQTGHPLVDEVVADVDDLGDRPLEEHVAVFESAHERLRRALDVSDAPG